MEILFSFYVFVIATTKQPIGFILVDNFFYEFGKNRRKISLLESSSKLKSLCLTIIG